MNRKELERLILEGDEKDLSPAVLAEIEADPACKALLERTRAVARLVALKNYERPADGLEARSRQAIMRRIRQTQGEPEGAWSRFWEVLTGPALVPVRYAAAAAAVAVVALYALSLSGPPASTGTGVAADERPADVETPLLLASTNIPDPLTVGTPAMAAHAPDGGGVSNIQYGPLPSVPVSFDPSDRP
jgi:hypothetical protein